MFQPRRQSKRKTEAVGAQGNGSVFATKVLGTQGNGSIFATKVSGNARLRQ